MSTYHKLLAIALPLALGFALCALAQDVVVIVSADNPVDRLSRQQITDIYLGRSDSFPDGRTANPIDQKPGSPAREIFYETVVGRTSAQVRDHWSGIVFTGRGQPPPEVKGDGDMRERVATDPTAIGYVTRDYVDDSVRIVEID